MFRQSPLLALLLLLMSSPAVATESAEEAANSEASVNADAPGPELSLITLLGGTDAFPILKSPPCEATATPAEGAVTTQGFGGCYTGCDPQLNSICPVGKVAEITATGPIQACGLADIKCVDRCIGPIVSCNSFALCF